MRPILPCAQLRNGRTNLCAAALPFTMALTMPRPVLGQYERDLTFATGTGADQPICTMAVQPDGKILIGGGFTHYDGVVRPCIARSNVDGSLDTSFDPGGIGANHVVREIDLSPEGKILIVGDFIRYQDVIGEHIALLTPDGDLDRTFQGWSGADASIHSADLDPLGRIVVGGEFTSHQGVPRNKVARLNPNGSLDITNWGSGTGPNADVDAVLPFYDPDGLIRVVVGGAFTQFGGEVRYGPHELRNDGVSWSNCDRPPRRPASSRCAPPCSNATETSWTSMAFRRSPSQVRVDPIMWPCVTATTWGA